MEGYKLNDVVSTSSSSSDDSTKKTKPDHVFEVPFYITPVLKKKRFLFVFLFMFVDACLTLKNVSNIQSCALESLRPGD